MKTNKIPTWETFRYWLVICLFLITSAACTPQCDHEELVMYINTIETTHEAFKTYINQSMNHPEFKIENVEKMKALKEEFYLTEPPRCATDLSKLAIKAMTSSITYLAPSQDIFYYPYQLAKFALDDWLAVEEESANLLLENPD